MRKTIPFALLFFLFQVRVFAQLSLPFFDDFARYPDRLDPAKWETNSGVYVNDRFSKVQVSKNMVTFNGFFPDGRINPSSSLTQGGVDTLTSKVINLSGRNASDSVYLSFFLQTGGVGLNPGSTAGFVVEFLSDADTWEQVFSRNGSPTNPNLPEFTPFFIGLSDPKFFHSNFRFRFRSRGRINLSRDTWNLDYVYLNSGRQKNNALMTLDVAVTRSLNSLLQNYTAMPAHQFTPADLNDSLFTVIQNLSGQIRPDSLYARVQIDNNAPVTIGEGSVALDIKPNATAQFPWVVTPPAAPFAGINGRVNIKSTLIVQNYETDPETRYNDTISRITPLQKYYAYDDGSAESVTSVQQGITGQIAQKFNLNKKDQVEGIMFYLPKFQNRKGTFVTFRIWDADANGNPNGTSRYSVGFTVPDTSQLDTFFIIPVNPPLPVNNSFFIGWGSSNQFLFSVGVDKNESARGNIRSQSSGAAWINFNPEGAIMLRPVMNNEITGISEDQLAQNVQVYPNPATSVVNIRGAFDSLRLLSLTGQVLMERTGSATETQIQTSHLKPGLYLLQLHHQNQIQTHKLIIQSN